MSNTIQLIQVISDEHNTHIRQLFSEYIQWMHERLNQEYGITFDVNMLIDNFMKGVDVFYPPQGRMYLAKFGDEIAGIGCLKELGDEICEIKRMFVKDEYREKGIGKAILDQLIADARSKGCAKIRLDSPKIFTMSHGLYQSRGFKHIDQYEGSEAGELIPDLAVYMELSL